MNKKINVFMLWLMCQVTYLFTSLIFIKNLYIVLGCKYVELNMDWSILVSFFVFSYCYLFAGWMDVFEVKFYINYLDLEYDGTEFSKLRSVHAIRANLVWNPTC